MYIWAYTKVIFQFLMNIFKDNKNWLLIQKTVPGGVSWPLGPTENRS
jgi:hypothetical protein